MVELILPSNLPLVIAELVAVVISRDNVYKQDVFGFGIHPSQFHFVAWKHSPERKRKCVRTALTATLDLTIMNEII